MSSKKNIVATLQKKIADSHRHSQARIISNKQES